MARELGRSQDVPGVAGTYSIIKTGARIPLRDATPQQEVARQLPNMKLPNNCEEQAEAKKKNLKDATTCIRRGRGKLSLPKVVIENTLEMNLRKKSLALPAYISTGALGDIRPARRMNKVQRLMEMSIVHKAEEETTCIQVYLKQVFQRAHFTVNSEQPRPRFLTKSPYVASYWNGIYCRSHISPAAFEVMSECDQKTNECIDIGYSREGSIEQRRNAKAGGNEIPRENPPTSDIVRHDSYMRNSGATPPGNRTRHSLECVHEGVMRGGGQGRHCRWRHSKATRTRPPETRLKAFRSVAPLTRVAGRLGWRPVPLSTSTYSSVIALSGFATPLPVAQLQTITTRRARSVGHAISCLTNVRWRVLTAVHMMPGRSVCAQLRTGRALVSPLLRTLLRSHLYLHANATPCSPLQEEMLNIAVLYVLEPASSLHWLLHRYGATPISDRTARDWGTQVRSVHLLAESYPFNVCPNNNKNFAGLYTPNKLQALRSTSSDMNQLQRRILTRVTNQLPTGKTMDTEPLYTAPGQGNCVPRRLPDTVVVCVGKPLPWRLREPTSTILKIEGPRRLGAAAEVMATDPTVYTHKSFIRRAERRAQVSSHLTKQTTGTSSGTSSPCEYWHSMRCDVYTPSPTRHTSAEYHSSQDEDVPDMCVESASVASIQREGWRRTKMAGALENCPHRYWVSAPPPLQRRVRFFLKREVLPKAKHPLPLHRPRTCFFGYLENCSVHTAPIPHLVNPRSRTLVQRILDSSECVNLSYLQQNKISQVPPIELYIPEAKYYPKSQSPDKIPTNFIS
ncbi:hypothetical protein PR048_030222 [Dryococelus australis]|uniref:Uncharacterized protein n=1 Tax=Dryococelus australis TaxID=614101 RepID=A0ABQ9G8S5_9NEOP|nr:hypothetical protein PR048_030222 [Dryococelus australis]